jgi:hypothetical protein
MYNTQDDPDFPETTPLTPRPQGKGLPVPPVMPLVAVLSILAGLALGYGLAPRAATLASPTPRANSAKPAGPPIATPAATIPAEPKASPPGGPTGSPEIPPPGGLSLAQALEAFRVSFGPPAEIISARVARYPPVTTGWVWLIVVPYFVQECDDPALAGLPGSPRPTTPGCRYVPTTEMLVLDYVTGELLEDRIPAG